MFGFISKLFSCFNRPKLISMEIGGYEYSVRDNALFRSTIVWWEKDYHRIYEQIGVRVDEVWVYDYCLYLDRFSIKDSDAPWELPDPSAILFIDMWSKDLPDIKEIFDYNMPKNIAMLLDKYSVSRPDFKPQVRYKNTNIQIYSITNKTSFLSQVSDIILKGSRIDIGIHPDNPIVSTTPYIENIWKYEAKTSIMDFEFVSTPKCLYQYCTTVNRWVDHGDNVLRLNFTSIRDMVEPKLSPVFVADITARDAIAEDSHNGVVIVVDATDIGSSCAIGCVWNYISKEWEILPEPTSIPLVIATVGDTRYVWSLTKQLWMLIPKTSKKDN